MTKPKRFIDNDELKQKLSELQDKLLEDIDRKLDKGLLEPQEARLLWDMIKTHGVGIESVDDLVKKAQEAAEGRDIDLDETDKEWSFGD